MRLNLNEGAYKPLQKPISSEKTFTKKAFCFLDKPTLPIINKFPKFEITSLSIDDEEDYDSPVKFEDGTPERNKIDGI